MTQAKLDEIIKHLRDKTSIDLRTCKGFKILEQHETAAADGFEFAVDDRRALELKIRGSSKMAEDLGHTDHYLPWTKTKSFGFTEPTQPDETTHKWPSAIHIDFALDPKGICGLHLDHDHRVVGRSGEGNAICSYASDGIVKWVIHEVALRGIALNSFNIRPIKVYDEPEPRGFDFDSCDIGAIEAQVQSLSTNNATTSAKPLYVPAPPRIDPTDLSKKTNTDKPFRHDNSSDLVGWIGNRVTLGEGYREKGAGLRVHIELAKDYNLGNVHLDTHGYLTEDGGMDPRRAVDHAMYDLITGYGIGGRTSKYTWRVLPGLQYTPKGGKDQVDVGTPMEPPSDGQPIEGWTWGIKIEIKRRKP